MPHSPVSLGGFHPERLTTGDISSASGVPSDCGRQSSGDLQSVRDNMQTRG